MVPLPQRSRVGNTLKRKRFPWTLGIMVSLGVMAILAFVVLTLLILQSQGITQGINTLTVISIVVGFARVSRHFLAYASRQGKRELLNCEGEAKERRPMRRRKMDKEQYHAAKMQLVAGMQEGQSWQQASANAGLQISRSTAYRLWLAMRESGEAALKDGRQGHPIKLRGAAREFLHHAWKPAPHTPSSTIQVQLRERFDVSMSISQINRVRAALGVSNHLTSRVQEKKQK